VSEQPVQEYQADEDLDPAMFDFDPGGLCDPELEPAFDPELGADGDDIEGWLAGLPTDVRAEFEAGPWTGDGEAWAAGFLHHEDGPTGTGFAAGGVLDRMQPGPLLARMTAAVTTAEPGGHAALGESELIGVMCGWQRLASWAAAGTAAAVVTLDRRRRAQARERQNEHLAEHVSDEVAAALALTGRAARTLAVDAAGLARLPDVHAALAEGRFDWRRATVFTGELDNISEHAARQIAAHVLPGADRMTTTQIQRVVRRLVLDDDPGADARRKDDARQDTDVHCLSETSGNAGLAGRELPEVDVITADRRLTAIARWLHQRGAPGSLGHLRAAAYLAQLNGRPITSLLPDTAAGAAVAASVEPDSPLAAAAGPAVTGTVNLTLPLSAWARLTDTAGEVAGHGPADATTCRGLAGQLAAHPATRWCLTITGPAGQALAHARAQAGAGELGAPPPGAAAWRWAAGLASRLAWLQTGTCAHDRQEHQYGRHQSWPA
jgi:hypothetical protein